VTYYLAIVMQLPAQGSVPTGTGDGVCGAGLPSTVQGPGRRVEERTAGNAGSLRGYPGPAHRQGCGSPNAAWWGPMLAGWQQASCPRAGSGGPMGAGDRSFEPRPDAGGYRSVWLILRALVALKEHPAPAAQTGELPLFAFHRAPLPPRTFQARSAPSVVCGVLSPVRSACLTSLSTGLFVRLTGLEPSAFVVRLNRFSPTSGHRRRLRICRRATNRLVPIWRPVPGRNPQPGYCLRTLKQAAAIGF